MADYPEHEKLDEPGPEAVTRFIEWLQDNDMMVARIDTSAPNGLVPGPNPSELIIKHFDVDKQKLEAERVAMLEALRKLDTKGPMTE
ncbi:hypothetical protein [[Arthrobacter] sp. ATCC 21022]|uniref:Uncharacterized protein n=2 Tax=Marthavirus martha TaxID=1980950 RepID=A0A0U4K927_9CAUD|nr:hypothetical protein FDH49_gp62 [Arthrobacter phage Martha]ALY09715.1 hypothetical protein MARTHA_62 [Arthrobacter phage Martha]ALY10520.1 hypothetical protein TAEYOUNG_63 [Arthrobacter phage TaeYoung]KUR66403.1 hypothetical protein JM67_00075 [Arthrobacter sp. ATCC 21022]